MADRQSEKIGEIGQIWKWGKHLHGDCCHWEIIEINNGKAKLKKVLDHEGNIPNILQIAYWNVDEFGVVELIQDVAKIKDYILVIK